MKPVKADEVSESKLIADIENKFGILLTISIFFPVLMDAYFMIAGGTPQEEHQAFVLFPLVGLYILSYVLFEISKILPPIKLALQALDWGLLLGIACFATPILFSIVALGPLKFSSYVSFQINMSAYVASLTGIGTVPFIILFFTAAILVLEMFAAVCKKLAYRKIF